MNRADGLRVNPRSLRHDPASRSRPLRVSARLWPWALVALALAIQACTPYHIERGPRTAPPDLAAREFIAEDGTAMPVQVWPAEGGFRAIVVAVHGMNEHARAFELPAGRWAAHGITTYAFDQRGFGNGPGRGLWPGTENLVRDLAQFVCLVGDRHEDVPLFVLGESMGGGVVLRASGQGALRGVAGLILIAPAAVPMGELPFHARSALWLFAHTIPWATVTGEGLGLKPTDNIKAWHEMSRDERTILATRIDAIWGLVRLMDAAARAAPEVPEPILFLYGKRDDFVRERMTRWLIAHLPQERTTVKIFEDRHHWLLRDLDPGQVDDVILDWVAERAKEDRTVDRMGNQSRAGGCGVRPDRAVSTASEAKRN